jgi:hypothetical protein
MPCKDRNPLLREGTSHLTRVLKALSTGYAKPDERQEADVILFTKQYAAYLNYYNPSNIIDGNWEPLMRMDASVPLAVLSKINVRTISDYKKLLYKRIRIAPGPAKAVEQFTYLFDCFFSLKKMIDEQYDLVADDTEYKTVLQDVMTRKIEPAVSNLVNRYSLFVSENLINVAGSVLDADAPLLVYPSATIDKTGWDTPAADIFFNVPATFSIQEKIIYIINHNLFNAQFEMMLNGVATIVKIAEKLFIETLGDFPNHSPHYALFLSFLKIFRVAQDHLNTYPQRHLDFYYKDVLKLKNKDPEPDSAHLTFELQKPVEQSLLKKDSLFKGGKDITDKEIHYVLTEDVVLNKATVSKIQSLQLVYESETKAYLKSAPIANSKDGQGSKITTADKSWFTFGDPDKEKNAVIGFAVVSNLFFLNEGTRTVLVSLTLADDIPVLSVSGNVVTLDCFTARLTGKTGWHEVQTVKVSYNPAFRELILSFQLNPEDPPVIPFSLKIHKDEPMEVSLPVVKFSLKQGSAGPASYLLFRDIRIKSIDVRVHVQGIRGLMLSNNNGSVDASKPFKPFGDFPAKGSSFYIGSKEIFQKNLISLNLNFNWKDTIPALNSSATYLRGASWQDSFTMSGDMITFPQPGKAFIQTAIDFEKNEALKITTLEGFLRINLDSEGFSMQDHFNNLANDSNSTTIKWDSTTEAYIVDLKPVTVPGEIVLDSFSISYFAHEKISFDPVEPNPYAGFYHLTPFGYYKVPFTPVSDGEIADKNTVLPNIIHNGELFIGLEKAEPDLVITILFQVADGSSNPLRNMETLNWYYLAENDNWKEFKKQFVVDRTNNLTQSGIVTLTLPGDISEQNTYMQKGLSWIKVAVPEHTDAVCKMILIKAQAARVTLVQDETNQIEFRQTLPSESISKLVVSDGTIKTIGQPFDSFNGRTRETDALFYVRVSERLRHKQRGITIWDDEHILLEKFPALFKVKCLNHSGFYFDKDNNEIFCENYPGHVTIIPVSDLKKKTSINPLRPYTSIGVINNMMTYLRTIISPFVKLHIKNPQFEEIQLDFKVKYYEGIDTAFYTQLLNAEIEKFLCPWAYEEGSEISFGGKIIKSALLNFVEERAYVDFVTCFKMNHIIREGTMVIDRRPDVEVAAASTSRSILISYYNEEEPDEAKRKHLIDPIISCDC